MAQNETRSRTDLYTGSPPKSKPLPSDRKIVLNRIRACQ